MKFLNLSVAFLTATVLSQGTPDQTTTKGDNKTFSVSVISGDGTQTTSAKPTEPSATTITNPTSQQESQKPSVTSVPETTTDQKTETPTATTTTVKKTTTTTTTTTTKDAPWTPPPPVATFGPSNGYTVVPSIMSMGLIYFSVTYLSEMI
jgi:hypothetical protein